jgi:hypothetical protein
MNIFYEIKNYISEIKHMSRQIDSHKNELRFETWIYSDTIHISDSFRLNTTDMYIEVMKYYVWWAHTRFRIISYNPKKPRSMKKRRKLFDKIVARIIFNKCLDVYKNGNKK